MERQTNRSTFRCDWSRERTRKTHSGTRDWHGKQYSLFFFLYSFFIDFFLAQISWRCFTLFAFGMLKTEAPTFERVISCNYENYANSFLCQVDRICCETAVWCVKLFITCLMRHNSIAMCNWRPLFIWPPMVKEKVNIWSGCFRNEDAWDPFVSQQIGVEIKISVLTIDLPWRNISSRNFNPHPYTMFSLSFSSLK